MTVSIAVNTAFTRYSDQTKLDIRSINSDIMHTI
jgi:hypothetical protein